MTAALAYSADELAPLLGVSPSHLRRMARQGQVPNVTLGGRIVFPVAAIDRWLALAGSGAQTGDSPTPGGAASGDLARAVS